MLLECVGALQPWRPGGAPDAELEHLLRIPLPSARALCFELRGQQLCATLPAELGGQEPGLDVLLKSVDGVQLSLLLSALMIDRSIVIWSSQLEQLSTVVRVAPTGAATGAACVVLRVWCYVCGAHTAYNKQHTALRAHTAYNKQHTALRAHTAYNKQDSDPCGATGQRAAISAVATQLASHVYPCAASPAATGTRLTGAIHDRRTTGATGTNRPSHTGSSRAAQPRRWPTMDATTLSTTSRTCRCFLRSVSSSDPTSTEAGPRSAGERPSTTFSGISIVVGCAGVDWIST